MPSILKRIFSRKLTAIYGLVGPLLTYAFILIAISLAPWFSWTANALSDLGNIVTHTASAPVFNYGLIIGGVVITLFAIGMVLEVKGNIMGLLGALTLVTSGLGIFFVGVFPENFILQHVISAFTYFISIIVGSFLFGVAYSTRKSTRFLGVLVFALGVVAAFGLFLLPILIQLPGAAIPEMIGSVAQYIWVIIICARLLSGKSAIPKK
ncbi:MAG: DUF998 domain-containing protein [Promethearchaeati archaeon SRVP18_Atabeyarchaeia-1]